MTSSDGSQPQPPPLPPHAPRGQVRAPRIKLRRPLWNCSSRYGKTLLAYLPPARADVGQARTEVRNAVAQLDDYILPRYRSLDAPLLAGVGEAAGIRKASTSRLAAELATAANVPLVADAVATSYRLESARRTGWPATRWLLRRDGPDDLPKFWWWGVFNVVQWLALAVGLGGLGWLGVLAGLAYLQLPVPEVPRVEGWPLPILMIAGGVALGIFLALTGKVVAAGAARARAAKARKRLRAAVGEVAGSLVVEPVEIEVSRLSSFNAALKAARPA